MQAVRAAAEALQPPAESAPDSSSFKPSQKTIGPKKPPAAAKTARAKPIFVKKRASADPAAALDQVTTIVCDVVINGGLLTRPADPSASHQTPSPQLLPILQV